MADNDIYKSKEKYELFVRSIDLLASPPEKYSQRKYTCKNPTNLQYFYSLVPYFEARDTSYIRRLRLFHVMKFICYVIDKDLKDCDRLNVDKIMAEGHLVNHTIKSKQDLVRDVKCLWKILFPERDEKGRVDDTIVPYPVRHLRKAMDKSKEKLRNDRFTWSEYQQIVKFFANDIRLQAFITFETESLGRPQEILYTRIKNYEFYDSFAKVWIGDHGKEGTGFMISIDSYPYLMECYRQHPLRDNPEAFFFINTGKNGNYEQMTNANINKYLKKACKALGINKNITCYSFKRNGVTFCRQRGDSDLQIQHKARWTSTKQLQIYDMSNQEDALQIELEKRGLKDKRSTELNTQVKVCSFCTYQNGFTAEICVNCKRPLDRKKIEEMSQMHQQMANSEMIQRLNRMEKLFEKSIQR